MSSEMEREENEGEEIISERLNKCKVNERLMLTTHIPAPAFLWLMTFSRFFLACSHFFLYDVALMLSCSQMLTKQIKMPRGYLLHALKVISFI